MITMSYKNYDLGVKLYCVYAMRMKRARAFVKAMEG